jgi:DHA3 family macrolide efflux protein-like MFS transporter
MNSANDQLSFREVLKVAPVRRLWAAQIVSIFGDFLAIFAVYSLVTFKFHGTASQVSSILIAYLFPLAILGPIAGAFVDRWNLKVTMISSDLIRAVLALLLLFADTMPEIYAIFLALSAVSSFFLPAQSVMVRAVVPAAGLMAANALMAQALQVMQIVSPAIAGALVAFFGARSCFWLDSFSFVFSALMIAGLPAVPRMATGPRTLRSIGPDIFAGVKFIFTHRAISFVIISMAAGLFAIRCFGALIAVYVRDVLLAGSMLFGALSSLVGVGMIIGTQLVNKLARTRSKDQIVLIGLFGCGLAIVETALFGRVTSTVIGMLGLGFSAAFIMIAAQTLLQQETPREMLGRVSSSMISVLSMAQVVAMSIAGPVAQTVGIRNLYFGSAGLLFVISAIGYRWLHKPGDSPAVAAEAP